jgi:hypothetical protein
MSKVHCSLRLAVAGQGFEFHTMARGAGFAASSGNPSRSSLLWSSVAKAKVS